jgi:hypothetical protein
MSREEALRLYTLGSAWFSGEEGEKGLIAPGRLADVALLSADYFSVPDEDIRGIESVLTVVGGRVVYGAGEFNSMAPPLPPVSPGWSPVATYGGYASQARSSARSAPAHALQVFTEPLWPGIGCDCFAF